MGNGFIRAANPDVMPDYNCEPSFDPLLGAPNRKERISNVTKEEMISAKIPLKFRDYCVDKLLKYQSCRADSFPFVYKCAHERHEYMNCEYEDYVLRMKEFEREKRLLYRQKRIEAS